MEPATLRRRPDAEVPRRLRQPQEGLRGAPGRQVHDRGHRPPAEPPTGEGRSDRGDPPPGPEASRADAEDHRRPVEYGARARRPPTEAIQADERVGPWTRSAASLPSREIG